MKNETLQALLTTGVFIFLLAFAAIEALVVKVAIIDYRERKNKHPKAVPQQKKHFKLF